MSKLFARLILKYRLPILIITIGLTVFMGYFARKIEITYNFAKLLPDSDSASIDYDYFKSKFGQDGNVLVIGVDKDKISILKNYKEWDKLGNRIKSIPGIKEVVSIARLNDLKLNDSLGKFEFKPLQTSIPKTQHDLDTLLEKIETLKFYEGIVFIEKNNCTLMAVTFNEKVLNTKDRLSITDSIRNKTEDFIKATSIQAHYSGLPFIRTTVSRKIANEMTFFLGVAFLVTALLLFLFFKSIQPVIFSLLVIVCGVSFTLGSIVLLGYKLTVLSGLIPPLIIVIGVPNCILILNKYHSELINGASKIRALHTAISRSSVSLFFANITTSIGFAVFCAIKNQILFEFGLISSINVMVTFLISLLLIPIIFSYLPAPKQNHLKHLDNKRLRSVLAKVALITTNHRKTIYVTIAMISIVSLFGLFQIKSIGYVVDDLPSKDPLLADLHYFEKNYGGVLPFEIIINTKEPNGVLKNNARALYKINRAQKMLSHYKELARALSVVEIVKFMYQSYKGGEAKYYKMPTANDLKNLAEYVKSEKEKENQLRAFVDSTKQYTRISIQMADIGSVKIKSLIKELKPRIDSIFNYNEEDKKWLSEGESYDVRLTGNSLMFLKGNEFLVNNLIESVVLAIVLIAIFMLTLFTSLRMILISTIPSLVALIITAGLMGLLGIPLKPSTILVFSIAFGISSDGTLYFLTKYRHEIRKNKLSITDAVRITISETGVSMVYTAVVLFFGFGMFVLSGFGGTQALGILISFTLLVAYCSNLILLPAFLLSLEKRITNKRFIENEPMIDSEEIIEQDHELNFDDHLTDIKNK
ncbi:MAG: efflux RND transporter permease subunit [Bacteroidota bacterium]